MRVEGFLPSHECKGDASQLSSKDDLGGCFGQAFVELRTVVAVEAGMVSCGLRGTEEQAPLSGFTALGEFAFALKGAGLASPDIEADIGDERIAAGEAGAMEGADEGGGVERPDPGQRQAALVVILPAEGAYQRPDALIDAQQELPELSHQRLMRQLHVAERLPELRSGLDHGGTALDQAPQRLRVAAVGPEGPELTGFPG